MHPLHEHICLHRTRGDERMMLQGLLLMYRPWTCVTWQREAGCEQKSVLTGEQPRWARMIRCRSGDSQSQ